MKIKFHPVGCDTLKSSIDHECGHLIDDAYKVGNDRVIIDIYNRWTALSEERGIDALSRYAWEQADPVERKSEFIAEAWAEYLNNPTPRDVARQIGDRMMEIIKNA